MPRLIQCAAALSLLLAPLALAPALAQPDDAVPVRVAKAQETAIRQQVLLTGSVTSARHASLSPAINGLVVDINVDSGSRVQQGDPLLSLDPEPSRWQWESAKAAVRAADIAVQDAKRRLAEARSLAPKQSIAETLVRDLAAEVEADEAALQQARADEGYRKALVERHELKAPFAGVVSEKLTELGEWVVPGTPVLTLVATGDLRLEFPVTENHFGSISDSADLRYSLGGDAGPPRDTRIDTVVPVSDPGARTFLLRALPAGEDPRLVPGQSVHAQLDLDTGRRGVVVPRDAVLKYPDGRVVVWTLGQGAEGAREADGGVVERLVTTGLAFDGLVEIREGIAPAETVIVQGNEALQPGQRVRVLDSRAD